MLRFRALPGLKNMSDSASDRLSDSLWALPLGADAAPASPAGSARLLARTLWRTLSVRVGGAIVILVVLAALAAPVAAALTGHGPTEQFRDVAVTPEGLPIGPGNGFALGADGNGRDVLVRTLYGAQVSLLVGIPATTLALLIGTFVGLVAGFVGGRSDRLISLGIDVALAFPFVVTALGLIALNRSDSGEPLLPATLVVVLIIALFSWTYFARITRAEVVRLRSSPLVEAARMSGAGTARILLREILPNIAPLLIVYWAVQLPANIIAEATLSFLGVGIQAPDPSWGNMISDAQRTALYQVQPWFLAAPALALFLTVAGFNTLSAGLRQVLDPRHQA